MVGISSIGYPVPAAPVQSAPNNYGMGSPTAISVFTPAWTQPNTGFWVCGIISGFAPLNLQLSTNGTSGPWSTVGNYGVDPFGNYSFYVPFGLPAGTYTIAVRDMVSSVTSAASGNFVVDNFAPQNTTTGRCLLDMDFNDPTIVMLSGGGSTLRPVSSIVNKVNQSEYMTALGGSATANPIYYQIGNGADGARRGMLFKYRTTSPLTSPDPTTNQFQGGSNALVSGASYQNNPMRRIISFFNSVKSGAQSFTCVQACAVNTGVGATFGAGLLAIGIPGPTVPWIQVGARWNPAIPGIGAQIVDAAGNSSGGTLAVPSTGWYVFTTLCGGGTITTLQNQSAFTTGPVTISPANGDMSAINELSLGGDGGTRNFLNGAAYTNITYVGLWAGLLSGSDLTSAITRAGNSCGISI